MSSFSGKSVLVLGGSRGIGAAIVRRFAADGATVSFTYSGSPTPLTHWPKRQVPVQRKPTTPIATPSSRGCEKAVRWMCWWSMPGLFCLAMRWIRTLTRLNAFSVLISTPLLRSGGSGATDA